ncbi:hypothetical protein GF415_01855 [Candidatus Micrarchaeota archaeon]|nr:hypothetical protein [Candidatus Micrarchaeota archaeon]
MIVETRVEDDYLRKRYPLVPPALADRALNSRRLGGSAIYQIGQKFCNRVGFNLLLDVYTERRDRGENEVAEDAFETAIRMLEKFSGKKRRECEERIKAVAPEEWRDLTGTREAIDMRDVPPGLLGFRVLLEIYSKTEGEKAEKIKRRMLELLGKMPDGESQKAISEVETKLGERETAELLLEIMEKEDSYAIMAKARVHFLHAIERMGGEEYGNFAYDLRDVLHKPEGAEIMRTLLRKGGDEALEILMQKCPEKGMRYIPDILNVVPEKAGEEIEFAEDAITKAGISTAVPELTKKLEFGVRKDAATENMISAMIGVLNHVEPGIAEQALEKVGLWQNKNSVRFLDIVLNEKRTRQHVKAGAAKALHLTGKGAAVDVLELALDRYGDGGIRRNCYESLTNLFFLDEPRVEHLIAKGADDREEDARIRIGLIRWLGENGGKTAERVLRGIASRDETSEKIINSAVEAVGTIYQRKSRVSLRRGDSKETISAPPGDGCLVGNHPVRITPIRSISSMPPRNGR